jgi:hypothetical protein
MKVRNEQEGKIEGILTKAQRKQWRDKLGKPFELEEKKRDERSSTPTHDPRINGGLSHLRYPPRNWGRPRI